MQANNLSAALQSVDQLTRSERGTAALISLSELLWRPCNNSLDTLNQAALVTLLSLSLRDPTVRDRVQRAAFDARGSQIKGRQHA